MKEKYIKYIEQNIDDVCPYEDADRQKLYHIGFMQAVLSRLLLEDNRNLEIFKTTIQRIKDGRKE